MSRNPFSHPHQAFEQTADFSFDEPVYDGYDLEDDEAMLLAEVDMMAFRPPANNTLYPPGFAAPTASGISTSLLVQSSQIAVDMEIVPPTQPPVVQANPATKKRGRSPGSKNLKKTPDTTKTKRPKGAPKSARRPAPNPTIVAADTLLQQGQETVATYRRATNTNKAYAGHIRAVTDWISKYQVERKDSDPDFSDVFENLTERPAHMVYMFWTSRKDQVGFRSIEGSRSALKAYFCARFPDRCYVSADVRFCSEFKA